MAERKLVIVHDNAPLTELGHPTVWGPISSPTRLPIDQIVKLVMNGRKVEEANPADPYNWDLYVKLTLDNVRSDNFAVAAKPVNTKEKATPPEETSKEAAPEKVEEKINLEDALAPVDPAIEETVEVNTATPDEIKKEEGEVVEKLDNTETGVNTAEAKEAPAKKTSRKRKNK